MTEQAINFIVLFGVISLVLQFGIFMALTDIKGLLEARTPSNVGGGASKGLEAPPQKCDICGQLRDKNHNEELHYKSLCGIADTNNLRSKL